MIGWQTVFLGIIALATLVMAVVQIAVIIAAGRTARRIERLADRLEGELAPLFGHLNVIGRDASRAVALATAQVERVDRLAADVVGGLDDLVRGIRSNVTAPLRKGAATLAAFRAVLGVLGSLRARRSRSRAEDEDALFI